MKPATNANPAATPSCSNDSRLIVCALDTLTYSPDTCDTRVCGHKSPLPERPTLFLFHDRWNRAIIVQPAGLGRRRAQVHGRASHWGDGDVLFEIDIDRVPLGHWPSFLIMFWIYQRLTALAQDSSIKSNALPGY